jgi:uncharacterized protein (DUF3084 family)
LTGQSDWKDRLAHDLEQQSAHQRDLLVRNIAQICHDLEERCENVEEPLRKEQRKVEDLQSQNTKLRDMVSVLESEAADRKLLVDGLEGERMQWEADLDQLETKNDDLSLSLEGLRQKLQHAERQAKQARGGSESREIQLRADLLSREEILQQHAAQIDNLENNIAKLQADLEHQRANSEQIGQLHESVAMDLRTVQRDLEMAYQDISEKNNRIASLECREGETMANLDNVRRELGDKVCTLGELQQELLDLDNASKQTLASVESKYQADLRKAATQVSKPKLYKFVC